MLPLLFNKDMSKLVLTKILLQFQSLDQYGMLELFQNSILESSPAIFSYLGYLRKKKKYQGPY